MPVTTFTSSAQTLPSTFSYSNLAATANLVYLPIAILHEVSLPIAILHENLKLASVGNTLYIEVIKQVEHFTESTIIFYIKKDNLGFTFYNAKSRRVINELTPY